jgi:hypothetical protein
MDISKTSMDKKVYDSHTISMISNIHSMAEKYLTTKGPYLIQKKEI